MMCIEMVQNLKVVLFKNLHKSWSNFAILAEHKEKKLSFHFKYYNLSICAVNFIETFCTCSPNSLGQDLRVKIAKKEK
jgi:hypothetical protein